MGRKVFLSFLGTTNYLACDYEDGKGKVENVRFVQEATLKLHCADFTQKDVIYILATKDANKKNWFDYEHTNCKTNEKKFCKGLKSRLDRMPVFKEIYKVVDVEYGDSEAAIWGIFETAYSLLEEGDELVFDITHGFRSSPMLMMALINYSKFLKNITVRGVFYGAFEAKKGNVTPIWNLNSFSELQDWTNAANSFLRYGHSSEIKALLEKNSLNSLGEVLHKISLDKSLVRGTTVYEGGSFAKAVSEVNDVHENILPKPCKPILDKVKNRLEDYRANSIINLMIEIDWCIENNMTQQGVTFLSEALLSFFVLRVSGSDLMLDKTTRNIASSIANLYFKKKKRYELKDRTEWKGVIAEEDNQEIVEKYVANPDVKLFAGVYKDLGNLRNDLNHAGMRVNEKGSDVILSKFKQLYSKVLDKMTTLHTSEDLEVLSHLAGKYK